ncbi:hypothetical protein FFONT_0757 [Fervidicoccus fontis Kam940]|uniref:Uncharacterized protein n=1 Tax=Fervidicoccus fontis (strain DSM 19380 / JCM 18336 / VKM B-2539 / Kam940) TaxID=1163730 RepID=I0A188_FERFK|nr:hypothetical protein FFONT_0757 [Fervidicoccus fontis Kam940]
MNAFFQLKYIRMVKEPLQIFSLSRQSFIFSIGSIINKAFAISIFIILIIKAKIYYVKL